MKPQRDWPRAFLCDTWRSLIRKFAEQNFAVGDAAGEAVEADETSGGDGFFCGLGFEHFFAVDGHRDFLIDDLDFERVPFSGRIDGVFARAVFAKQRTG